MNIFFRNYLKGFKQSNQQGHYQGTHYSKNILNRNNIQKRPQEADQAVQKAAQEVSPTCHVLPVSPVS